MTQKVHQVGQMLGWGLRPQTHGATLFLGFSSWSKIRKYLMVIQETIIQRLIMKNSGFGLYWLFLIFKAAGALKKAWPHRNHMGLELRNKD